jgi:hypothetical protein
VWKPVRCGRRKGKIWVKKLSRRGAEIAEKVKQKAKKKTIFSKEGTNKKNCSI